MKLSDGEKLILLALADQKDGKNEIDLNFVRSAIFKGHSWALSWQFPGIATKDTSEAVAEETAHILRMWVYLESCISQLSKEDHDKLKHHAEHRSLEFSGFDGNHDEHFHVASFLINDMDEFEHFKKRGLNSHNQASLPKYRRMLPVYERELSGSAISGEMQIESIIKIIAAN